MPTKTRVELRLLPENAERLSNEAKSLNLSLPDYIAMRALEPRTTAPTPSTEPKPPTEDEQWAEIHERARENAKKNGW